MAIITGLSCRIGQIKKGVELAPIVLASCSNILRRNHVEYVSIFERSGYKRAHFLNAMAGNNMVFNIGGDHSVGHSTVAGMLDRFGSRSKIFWIDAHTDINTNYSSNTGNSHGMPLSPFFGLMNHWVDTKVTMKPKQLVYVGIRSVDPFEKKVLRDLNIKSYTVDDVSRLGVNEIMARELDNESFYQISFDIDSVDPKWAGSTGTPEPNGLYPDDVLSIFEKVKKTGRLRTFDLVEFNPNLGTISDKASTLALCKETINIVLKDVDIFKPVTPICSYAESLENMTHIV